MPVTRSNATAGPSRLSRPSKRDSNRQSIRRNAALSEDSAGDDVPPLLRSSSMARQSSKHSINTRAHGRHSAVNYEYLDHETTPRASGRNARQSSLATSTMSRRRSSALQMSNRRPRIRPSLTNAAVGEMTIERRMDMLQDVAGDTLVKLLKAGLTRDIKGKRRETEIQKAWDGLQIVAKTYVFPDYARPFPRSLDVYADLHRRLRSVVDIRLVADAIDVYNLAVFVWVIVSPDQAADLISGSMIAEDQDDDGMTSKPQGTRRDIVRNRIRRRNWIMVRAWKHFWEVVVPKEDRTDETALGLWLDFATQISLHYQSDTVSSGALQDLEIPEPPLNDLFSPSAVSRLGQWSSIEDSRDGTGAGESLELEQVRKRWERMARQRERELGRLDNPQSQFPYEEFQEEMLSYICYEILHAAPIQASSPLRSDVFKEESAEESDFRSEPPDVAAEDADIEMTDGSLGEPSGSEVDDEPDAYGEESIPFELDIIQAVAMEMERDAEFARALTASPRRRVSKGRSITVTPRQRVERSQTPSPKRATQESLESDEWAVRDHVPVDDEHERAIQVNRIQEQAFNFAARQEQAEQVGWESQSPVQIPPPEPAKQKTPPPIRRKTPPPIRVSVARHGAGSDVRPIPGSDAERTPRAAPRSSVAPSPANPLSHVIDRRTPVRVPDPREEHLAAGEILLQTSDASARINSPAVRDLPWPSSHQMEGAQAFTQQSLERYVAAVNANGVGRTLEQDYADDGLDDLLPNAEQLQYADFMGAVSAEVRHSEQYDPDDLLPDAAQLNGYRGSRDWLTDPLPFAEDEYLDLLPDAEQLEGNAQPTVELATPTGANIAFLLPDAAQLGLIADYALSHEILEDRPLTEHGPPSHHLDANDRPQDAIIPQQDQKPKRDYASIEAEEFLAPESVSDEEDRALLPTNRLQTWRRTSAVPLLSPDDILRPGPPPKRSRVNEPDLHLVDEDGSILKPDPAYVLPRNHVFQRSRIHGQIAGQTTAYSRISGKRKWTKAEEILLYRTVQKVPLMEEYPLRVAWYLHGEHGILSHTLEQYNPQHMKDKMRVIVAARMNNDKPVEGRARFWLPAGHPARKDFEAEVKEVKIREAERMREEALRNEEEEEEENDEESVEEEVAEEAEEEEEEEEEEDGDGEEEDQLQSGNEDIKPGSSQVATPAGRRTRGKAEANKRKSAVVSRQRTRRQLDSAVEKTSGRDMRKRRSKASGTETSRPGNRSARRTDKALASQPGNTQEPRRELRNSSKVPPSSGPLTRAERLAARRLKASQVAVDNNENDEDQDNVETPPPATAESSRKPVTRSQGGREAKTIKTEVKSKPKKMEAVEVEQDRDRGEGSKDLQDEGEDPVVRQARIRQRVLGEAT